MQATAPFKKKEEEKLEAPKPASDLFAERRLAHEEVIKQRPDAVGFFLGKKDSPFGESALMLEATNRVEKTGRDTFENSVKIELKSMKKGPNKKVVKVKNKKTKKEEKPPEKD